MRQLCSRNILTGFLLLSLLLMPLPSVCAAESADKTPRDLKNLSIEQLMDLEIDTVYGASRYEQKVTEAPSSVTIVTSDQIKKYGYRTLADLLKGVRGFYVSYDRNYSYVGVRGFGRTGDYNNRILLLVERLPGSQVVRPRVRAARIHSDAVRLFLHSGPERFFRKAIAENRRR